MDEQRKKTLQGKLVMRDHESKGARHYEAESNSSLRLAGATNDEA
jgi:hypothetical protein